MLMGFAGALQFIANAASFPYRLVPHTKVPHEGQEGLDTLMVLAQLGSGQYTIVS